MRIMVVDDELDIEPLFQQKFRKEIKQGKINLEFALSAEAALNKLRHDDHPSIVMILSDINMPGMSGLDLLQVIKQEFAYIRVFLVTAYGDDQNRQLATDRGADDFINKPVNFEALKSKIFSLMTS